MSTIVTGKRNLTQDIQAAFDQQGLGKSDSNKQAFELFVAKGFPVQRTEEYKFTPITRALEKAFSSTIASAETNITPDSLQIIPELTCNIIAFINGRFSKEQSVILDKDVKIQTSVAETAAIDSDPFDLLNQSFANEVVQIIIASKKTIEHPVAVVYYFDSSEFVFSNPRWSCKIGQQSSVSFLEYVQCKGETKYFNNKQSYIEIGENSHVEFTVIQNGPKTDIQTNNTRIHLSSNATVSCFTFTFEGQLIRNNLSVIVDGQGIDAHLNGLYLLAGNTLADNHTVVDHRKPNSNSNELYKGVMDGNSKGVFNGKIYVRPQAQKTNAFQSNRNILLSESATVNTKPQLEIWADDVKCSHGCTTGQLDEEALFYLRSRGISKEMARGMMLYAFAAQTLTSMKNETIRNYVDGLISEELQKNF